MKAYCGGLLRLHCFCFFLLAQRSCVSCSLKIFLLGAFCARIFIKSIS